MIRENDELHLVFEFMEAELRRPFRGREEGNRDREWLRIDGDRWTPRLESQANLYEFMKSRARGPTLSVRDS